MNLILLVPAVLALILVLGAVFTWAHTLRVERLYPATGRFMEIEGCRLHFLEQGPSDAEPLGTIVLLHGAMSNLVESMLVLGSGLASRYRVIAFDRPGHGWSRRRRGIGGAQPAWQAAIIAEALRRLEVRNAVVAGHSWSGAVVPHFGLDHTDVTGALFILSGVTHPWPGGYISWYDRLTASPLGWLFARTLAIPIGRLLFRSAARKSFSPQPVPPGFLEKAFIPLVLRPAAFHANSRDIAVLHSAVTRQSARYGEIRLPATVMGGDRDEIVWTDLHSRSFARDVAGAELIVLPGVGHLPQYARPELVLAAIEALAERVAPARTQPLTSP
jgi:pimeloyl-ACP methyl ester carboxylesterase